MHVCIISKSFVVETSKLMNSKMGILHIVNNYTGDKAAAYAAGL